MDKCFLKENETLSDLLKRISFVVMCQMTFVRNDPEIEKFNYTHRASDKSEARANLSETISDKYKKITNKRNISNFLFKKRHFFQCHC